MADNAFARVEQYSGSWGFGSLNDVNDQPRSHFAPRPDGTTTLDYVMREGVKPDSGDDPVVNGDQSRRDVFLFDGGGSLKARAPQFARFDFLQGDRLMFTGTNDKIYWQLNFVSERALTEREYELRENAQGENELSENELREYELREYELIFYKEPNPGSIDFLAVVNIISTRRKGEGWGDAPEITDVDSMFLPNYKPTLHYLLVKHEYFINDINNYKVELNDAMQGGPLVTDHFSGIPYNKPPENHPEDLSDMRSDIVTRHNNAQNENGTPDRAKEAGYDKVPVIRNFEDGRDKIVLESDHARTIWWRMNTTEKELVLYNVANPTDGNLSQQIAIIEGFEGTFNHEDFVFADGNAVSEDLIEVAPEIQ